MKVLIAGILLGLAALLITDSVCPAEYIEGPVEERC